jgi:hypothetical protein
MSCSTPFLSEASPRLWKSPEYSDDAIFSISSIGNNAPSPLWNCCPCLPRSVTRRTAELGDRRIGQVRFHPRTTAAAAQQVVNDDNGRIRHMRWKQRFHTFRHVLACPSISALYCYGSGYRTTYAANSFADTKSGCRRRQMGDRTATTYSSRLKESTMRSFLIGMWNPSRNQSPQTTSDPNS